MTQQQKSSMYILETCVNKTLDNWKYGATKSNDTGWDPFTSQILKPLQFLIFPV